MIEYNGSDWNVDSNVIDEDFWKFINTNFTLRQIMEFDKCCKKNIFIESTVAMMTYALLFAHTFPNSQTAILVPGVTSGWYSANKLKNIAHSLPVSLLSANSNRITFTNGSNIIFPSIGNRQQFIGYRIDLFCFDQFSRMCMSDLEIFLDEIFPYVNNCGWAKVLVNTLQREDGWKNQKG